MAIAYVGSASGLTTSVTEPAHSAGDILVHFAFRDGSTTAPGVPTGYTSIATITGTTCSARISVKTGTGTPASPTSTNATTCMVAAYSGVASIGAFATQSGTAASVTYPALSMADTTGASWVVGMAGHRSADTALGTAPTGMTNRVNPNDATDEGALHDTNGPVSSWSAGAVAVGGTASGWCAATVELVASAPAGDSKGIGYTELLFDDFNARDTAKWFYTGNPGDVVAGGGQLRIKSASYPAAGTNATFDLTNATAQVQFVSVVPGDSIEAYFELILDGTRRYFFIVTGATPTVTARYDDSGEVDVVSFSYTAGMYLRIRHSGSTIYYESSTNGRDWTTQGSTAQRAFAITAMTMSLSSGNWAGASSDVQVFDKALVYTSASAATLALAGADIGRSDSGAGDSIGIDAATLTLTGATVGQTEANPVTGAALSLTGNSIGQTETNPVTAATLTLAGATIGTVDGEATGITPATLTLSGKTVGQTETGAITRAALTLSGANIDRSDAVPAPVEPRTAAGGGLGPASKETIAAERAYRADKKRREQALDATIEGLHPETEKPAPASPQRSKKPLPATKLPAIEEAAPEPTFAELVAMIMAESVPQFIAREPLGFFDPDEDAAVLLLLA